MFVYKIDSTIQVHGQGDKIEIGDVLYDGSACEFGSSYDASEEGQDALNGLDGSRAFNSALDSAEVHVYNLPHFFGCQPT